MTAGTTNPIDELFDKMRSDIDDVIDVGQRDYHKLLKEQMARDKALDEKEEEDFTVDELKFAKAAQVLRQATEEPGPTGFFSRLRRDPSVLIERAYNRMSAIEVIYATAWAQERNYSKRYILSQIAKLYAAHERDVA